MKNTSLSANSYIRIPFRFSLIQIANNEFRFVSISESIKIKFENSSVPFAKIFSKLKDATTLHTLFNDIPKTKQHDLRDSLETLLSKGLLEIVNKSSRQISKTEQTRYVHQMKFFSNFHPLLQTDATNVSTEILDLQTKLKNSTILVVGLGRVGVRVLSALTSIGIGSIIGSDGEKVTFDDTVDQAFTNGEIGKIREKTVQKKLLNTSTKYKHFSRKMDIETKLPPNVDLLILCEDTFNPQKFDTINKLCLKEKIPWISYRNLGLKFEIGPTIIPYETACYKCLELRKMGAVSSYADYLDSQQSIAQQKINRGSLNIAVGAELLVLDILKTLTNFTRSVTYGNVFSFNLISFESSIHPVLRIPNCPHCSPSPERPLLDIWE